MWEIYSYEGVCLCSVHGFDFHINLEFYSEIDEIFKINL